MKTALLALLFFHSVASAQWLNLLEDDSLTVWQEPRTGYSVSDGVLSCSPQGKNLTSKAVFSDYVLDLEFKLSKDANNGIGIHYPGKGDAAYAGMELQILDNQTKRFGELRDNQFHGSIYALQAAERGHLKPSGKWNQQRIIVSGDAVTIILNGKVILAASLSGLEKMHPKHLGLRRRSGHITICGYGDQVWFRNMRIMAL